MQLALYEAGRPGEVGRAGEASRREVRRDARHQPQTPYPPHSSRLCAACREREARYGFRDEHAGVERPRTLCFDCFRMEMDRRRIVAAQLARGWNATQKELPLADKLETFARRRGRAQIAARHALDLR